MKCIVVAMMLATSYVRGIHKNTPYRDVVMADPESMKMFSSLVNDKVKTVWVMPECYSHEAWGGKDAKAIEKGSGLFNEPMFGKPWPRRFPAKHYMQEATVETSLSVPCAIVVLRCTPASA